MMDLDNFSITPMSFQNGSRLYLAEKNSWNTNHGGRYFPAVVLCCRHSDVQRFQIQCRYLKQTIKNLNMRIKMWYLYIIHF